MAVGDWPEIRTIYIDGIRTGHATFQLEEDVQSVDDGGAWFAGKVKDLLFKATEVEAEIGVGKTESMLGWAALSPVSSRCVYAGVAEVSIYLSASARGRGIGTQLLEHLITTSEAAGIWTLQAGIFPENQPSIKLHKKCGFRVVGIREKLGKMNGVWRDVMFMERRSPHI